jgi:hypothetical protein
MARVRYGARTEAEIAAGRTAGARLPDIWSTGVVALWETDPDALAAVLPPPLKPTGRPWFLAGRDRCREEMTRLGIRNETFASKWFHDNEEGLHGSWETAQRLKELDGDGVVAEVVFPDADAVDSRTAAPFGVGPGLSGDQGPELGLAGAQAHSR